MPAGVLVMLLVLAVTWGSAFPMIKLGLEGFSAPHLTLLRHLVASAAFLVVILALRGRRLPRARDLGSFALLGMLGFFVYHLALNFGELHVSAGAASLIIATAPAITAIIAAIMLGDRMPPLGWLGSAVAFSGVFLIVVGDGEIGFNAYALLILVAAIATAFYAVLQKRLFDRYRPIEVAAFATWAGTLPMLIFLPGLAGAVAGAPDSSLWATVYNGVFPSAFAYTLFSLALSRAPVTLVTAFLYLVPVFALGSSWLLIGEVPTLLTFAGGLVAILGIVLVNLAKQRRVAVASSASGA